MWNVAGEPFNPHYCNVVITVIFIIGSDRSSYSDDGLLYSIHPQHPLFQILTQSIDAIDVTSVTLSRLNSINAMMSQDAD